MASADVLGPSPPGRATYADHQLDGSPADYYGVPVIHRPHWKWLVITYFFFGGISAASLVIAEVATMVSGHAQRNLVRTGRYLSFAALLPCPALLTFDLARPRRFHHMLMTMNLRSPMSVGSWALTLFGGLCTVITASQATEDGLLGRNRIARFVACLPVRAVGAMAIPVGMSVAGYTGVLLAATAVPLWTKRALVLGPIFLCSSFSTASAAIAVVLPDRRDNDQTTRHRLAVLECRCLTTELLLLAAWTVSLGPTAKPLMHGSTGRVFRHGVVGSGITLPLLLHAIGLSTRGRASRTLTIAASLLALSGGFCLRYVVVVGGQRSADDPRATFELTRAPSRGAPTTRA